jgi:hypothetical protein
LIRQAPQIGFVLAIDLLGSLADLCRMPLSQWSNDEAIAVRREFDLGVRIDLQQLQNRLVNDEAETVPDGPKGLDHFRASPEMVFALAPIWRHG